MSELHEIHTNRVVYAIPGMESASAVSTHTYKTLDDLELLMDVYVPVERGEAVLPAVLFVHGDGPEEDLLHAREWGQYVSYGQLLAASGLAAVIFNHRSTQQLTRMDAVAQDIDDAIAFVRENAGGWGIDPERLCVWAISAGAPFGVCSALRALPPHLRCLVAFYGFLSLLHLQSELQDVEPADLERHSPLTYLREHGDAIPPLLIARAGRDRRVVNESIDQFVSAALERGVSFDLLNHADGQHGFDIFDDEARSRAIIRQTLGFGQMHLAG